MQRELNATREAGRALALGVQVLEVRQPKELPGALSALTGWRAGALLVLSDPVFGNELDWNRHLLTVACRRGGVWALDHAGGCRDV
jgi:hypothetical protein